MNDSAEQDARTPCRYGSECYQKNKQHLEKYKHPPKEVQEKEAPKPKKPRLSSGSTKQQKLISSFFKKNSGDSEKKKESEENIASNESTGSSTEKQTANSPVPTVSHADERPVNDSTTTGSSSKSFSMEEYQRIIKKLFLVEMPPDFFSFWEFCESLLPENPCCALDPVDLRLVGPFDVLAGALDEEVETDVAVRHWRYYYDPPEFQTVLKSNKPDLFHIGYYRDDPNKVPAFVCYNYASKNATITSIGENLFAALNWCMKHCESAGTPFKKVKFSGIKTDLQKWASEHDFSLTNYTDNMRKRDKSVVAKTFHHAGIVVPYDKKTELGYRPLSENATNLTKILKQIDNAKNDDERKAFMSKLHEVITWANIAVDEGDYGTGLELGIDLFAFGSKYFSSMIMQLLSSVYKLLDREAFATIIKAHLQDRKKGGDLSIIPKSSTLKK